MSWINRFGADAAERCSPTVDDVLGQLDHVVETYGPAGHEEDLEELTAWMTGQEKASPAKTARSTKTSDTPATVLAGFFVAGGSRAGAEEFIHCVSEFADLTPTLPSGVDAATAAKLTYEQRLIHFGVLPADKALRIHLYAPQNAEPTPMWDVLVSQTLGAVLIADGDELSGCAAGRTWLESTDASYLVVVNTREGQGPSEAEVRDALTLPEDVPIVIGDVRERIFVKGTLIALVDLLLKRMQEREDLSEELVALTLLSQLEDLLC